MIFEHWMSKTGGNLIQFLVGLDVVAHVEVAEIALKAFFDKIPNMLEGNFTDQFLQSMTAEMALTLRAYCEHQIVSTGSTEVISEILPELIVMNGYLRAKYDSIVTCSDDVLRAELEFVLNELIKVCSWLDFSDEVGRRAIFDTCQEIMSNLEICDTVYEQCIKLLTKHASSTEEFLNLMTTFISSFRDVYELVPSAQEVDELIDNYIPDDVRIMANLKALEIVRSVLASGNGVPEGISFARFPILVAYLDEIVIPSVNSQFAAVQAAGLKCLGLCCSIEKVN
jgi:condensin complex subunit 3